MSGSWRICGVALALMIVIALPGLADDGDEYTPPQPPDPISCEFNQGLSACPVQFDLYFNLVFVQASINSNTGCWFIVDSGFEYSLLNMDRLPELGLTAGISATDAQPGGEVEVAEVTDVSISFPCLDVRFDQIKAIPLAGLEPIVGRRIDGILGHDIFSRMVVEIDYQLEQMTFHYAKGFKYLGGGEIIPVTFKDNEAFFVAEIIQPERVPIEAKLKLDTGSSDFIGFNGSFVQAEGLVPETQPKLPVLGTAVGGYTENWVTRIMGFRVGNISFDDPVVGFSVDTLRGGDAGTIGGEFFRRVHAIFDYKQRRLILEENRHYNDPFEYDMSGIFPIALAPDFSTKSILTVSENSPAAEAGLQPGDIIEMVDDTPAADLTIAELRHLFMQPGKTCELQVLRAGERQRISLTLRRLI